MSLELSHSELPSVERLRWQCRRGLLELDYLLENFLERRYPRLPDEQKLCFVQLLKEPDPVLQAWVMGSESPDDPAFREIIELLRQFDDR